MTLNCNTSEGMAFALKTLFNLDEKSQLAALDSLSGYAKNQCSPGDSASEPTTGSGGQRQEDQSSGSSFPESNLNGSGSEGSGSSGSEGSGQNGSGDVDADAQCGTPVRVAQAGLGASGQGVGLMPQHVPLPPGLERASSWLPQAQAAPPSASTVASAAWVAQAAAAASAAVMDSLAAPGAAGPVIAGLAPHRGSTPQVLEAASVLQAAITNLKSAADMFYTEQQKAMLQQQVQHVGSGQCPEERHARLFIHAAAAAAAQAASKVTEHLHTGGTTARSAEALNAAHTGLPVAGKLLPPDAGSSRVEPPTEDPTAALANALAAAGMGGHGAASIGGLAAQAPGLVGNGLGASRSLAAASSLLQTQAQQAATAKGLASRKPDLGMMPPNQFEAAFSASGLDMRGYSGLGGWGAEPGRVRALDRGGAAAMTPGFGVVGDAPVPEWPPAPSPAAVAQAIQHHLPVLAVLDGCGGISNFDWARLMAASQAAAAQPKADRAHPARAAVASAARDQLVARAAAQIAAALSQQQSAQVGHQDDNSALNAARATAAAAAAAAAKAHAVAEATSQDWLLDAGVLPPHSSKLIKANGCEAQHRFFNPGPRSNGGANNAPRTAHEKLSERRSPVGSPNVIGNEAQQGRAAKERRGTARAGGSRHQESGTEPAEGGLFDPRRDAAWEEKAAMGTDASDRAGRRHPGNAARTVNVPLRAGPLQSAATEAMAEEQRQEERAAQDSFAEQVEGAYTDNPAETLRKHLQLLQTKDPRCIFIVRKINRLGFDSPTLLKQHYMKHGVVEAVLVAHSRVRCQNRSLVPWRLRPSGLGFVVMQDASDVEAILAQGQIQTVRDACIRLSPFNKKEDAESALDEVEIDGDA